MKVLDVRGEICPVPIIKLKKTLNELTKPFELSILTDNEISKNNLMKYLNDNNYFADCKPIENYWSITAASQEITITQHNITQRTPALERYNNNTIIVVKNNKMGFGDDDLGEILIKGFFNVISETDSPPAKIIFYNSGALLCVKTSTIIASLQILQEKGADIIICGACVDFYQLKKDIIVGRISNMFDITEILLKADKIVYP